MSIGIGNNNPSQECMCARRLAVCHHMAALCIFAHHNVSVTDTPWLWNQLNEDPEQPEQYNVYS